MSKHYFKKYEEYIKSRGKDWYIVERRQRICELFEKADIKDTMITVVEPLVYGHAQTMRISALENIHVFREDAVGYTVHFFKEAISVFKHRIFQAFSLIYWIESFILLPKKVLLYLGLKVDNIFVRIAQVLWWLMCLVGIVGSTIFNQEFRVWSNPYLPSWLSNVLGH